MTFKSTHILLKYEGQVFGEWKKTPSESLCSSNQSASLHGATAGSPGAAARRTMGIVARQLLHDKEQRGSRAAVARVAGCGGLALSQVRGGGPGPRGQVTPCTSSQ